MLVAHFSSDSSRFFATFSSVFFSYSIKLVGTVKVFHYLVFKLSLIITTNCPIKRFDINLTYIDVCKFKCHSFFRDFTLCIICVIPCLAKLSSSWHNGGACVFVCVREIERVTFCALHFPIEAPMCSMCKNCVLCMSLPVIRFVMLVSKTKIQAKEGTGYRCEKCYSGSKLLFKRTCHTFFFPCQNATIPLPLKIKTVLCIVFVRAIFSTNIY